MTTSRLPAWKEWKGRRVPTWVESDEDLAPRGPVIDSEAAAVDIETLEVARKKLEEFRSLADIDPKYLRVSAISVPAGVAAAGPNPEFPAKAALVPMNAGWWDKVDAVELDGPAMIRMDAGPSWSGLSDQDQSDYLKKFQELLEARGVKLYGALGSGVSNHLLWKASISAAAPSGNEFNLDAAVGDYIPAAMKDSPDMIPAAAAGKMIKRDKQDAPGGEHFLTPYPDSITGDRTVPISGPGGEIEVTYDISDAPVVYEWIDETGEKQVNPVNATDGGGDMDEHTARRIYEVQTGRPAPPGLIRIQTTWTVRETTNLQGERTGGTMKAMINVIPHREYQEKQLRQGFVAPMRISSDGLAKELANSQVAHGRTLFHFAKHDQWGWTPASGMMAQPMLDRLFAVEDFAVLHFQHSVEEAFYAAQGAQERATSVAERINAELPRGIDENGTLDPLDDEYMRNVRSERTIAQKFQDNEHALRTGSPYASPGAMDAVAGGATGKLNNLRRRGGGAPSISIPTFKGKRTDAENMPDELIHPPKGTVRLIEKEFDRDPLTRQRNFAHYVVFNHEDMADPNQLVRQSGPDNDDEYNTILARDPVTGEYKVLAWRDPIPPGGGSLYNAHPDDVRRLIEAGYPVMDLRPDYQERGLMNLDMADFFRKGNGMTPEVYDEARTKQLTWDMASDDPAIAMAAKRDFGAMVLGRGRVGIMADLQGIAERSGWIDGEDGWKEWAFHPDSLDAELVASGHNARTADQMAEKIVRRVKAGDSVDSGIMSVREGVRDLIGYKYADMEIEEMIAAGQRIPRGTRQMLMEEWRDIVEKQGVILPKWQAMDEWIQATEQAVKQIENTQMALANGPQGWLQARRRETPSSNRRGRNRRWIHSDPNGAGIDVDTYGRHLSDFWNRTYAQTRAFVDAEIDRRDVRRMTSANTAIRQELEQHYNALMWERIDREIVEALVEVRLLPQYEDGMLMGSFSQWELNRRADRNIPQADDIQERLFAHLRSRAFKAFDSQEQVGFYRGTDNRIAPTVVIDYEDEPWMRKNRRSGERIDTRRAGRGSPGWVRYRHEAKVRNDTYTGKYGIGPHASTNSKIMADYLMRLSQTGAEFRYLGDLGGRNKRGVWAVRFRGRKEMDYTPEQMLAWMEDRFHKGIPDEKLLPMWANLDDMADVAHELFTPSGRPAIVTSSAVRYGEYELTQPRSEFPDFEYEVELPPHLRRQIPDEAASMAPLPTSDLEPTEIVPSAQAAGREIPGESESDRLKRQMKDVLARTGGVQPGDYRLDPGIPAEDMDLPTNNLSADEAQDLIEHARRNEPGLNQRRRTNQAETKRNSATYNPTFGFDDPSVQPSRINRVGGRQDSMALMVNLMGEVQEAYGERRRPGTFIPRYDESKFIGKVWRGKAVGPVADGIVDALWRSPSLGHFTTARDAARAYRDWIGWLEGKIPALAAPGLRHAKTADEAAALVLKDLYMRAEERFWRNRELGYMDRQAVTNPDTGELLGFKWKHTRGKTNDLRQRVRPMISVRVPTPIAGYSIGVRLSYTGKRRKVMEQWLEELEMPEMFDGNPEKWGKATPKQLLDEFGRVYAARDRNMLKLWAMELFRRDKVGFEAWGRRYNPGVVQTADELLDLGSEIADTYRYFAGVMGDMDAENLEILARTSFRRGVEEVMERMGLPTVSPESAATDNPALLRDWTLRDTPIAQDYEKFKRVTRNARVHLEAGRWTQAGMSLKSLSSANTVQWLKRHSVIYTQTFGTDLSGRGLGRIIPIASQTFGGLRASALLDINTLFNDRDINNTIEGLKTGITRQGWDLLQRTNRNFYGQAKAAQLRGDEWTKKNGVRNAVIERIFDEDYNREWGERKKGGLQFKVIHRFQWYTMLTQGIGAKFMASAMRNKGIKVQKRWRLNRRAGLDWPCWTNGNKGWVDNDEEFPSGHHQPPAHPG